METHQWLWGGSVLVGYLWSAVAGNYFVSRTMLAIPTTQSAPGRHWHRGALGLVERILATTAVLIGSQALIAAWLVLKAASAWTTWKEQPGIFNRWAVGTVLSVGFGAAAGAMAFALGDGSLSLFAGAALGPVLVCGLIASIYRWEGTWWGKFWDPNTGEEPKQADRDA